MVGEELFAIDSLIFPGLACSYSLVCVDNNTWKQQSSEKQGTCSLHGRHKIDGVGWGGGSQLHKHLLTRVVTNILNVD